MAVFEPISCEFRNKRYTAVLEGTCSVQWASEAIRGLLVNALVLGPHRTKKCAQRLDRVVGVCASAPCHKKKVASTHVSLVGELSVETTF